jgi:hypothetical protein
MRPFWSGVPDVIPVDTMMVEVTPAPIDGMESKERYDPKKDHGRSYQEMSEIYRESCEREVKNLIGEDQPRATTG